MAGENYTVLGKFTEDFKFLEIDPLHFHARMFKKFGGKELEIEFKEHKKNRSSAQNRYFHGVVVPTIIAFEKERGADWLQHMTSKEATDAIKAYIYTHVLKQRVKVIEVDGMEVFLQEGKRMSEMNVEEFNLAVEEIRGYYNEMDCVIPEPIKNGFVADYINAQS
jgi:hypothetical protein